MTKNSFMMFEKYALPLFQDGMKVLEIGAIESDHPLSLEKLLKKFDLDYSNSDFDKGIHFIGGEKIDSPDNVFDIVFCANVIEHVPRPWIWINELVRVAKKNGQVIILSPITWGYHQSPLDCWRIYPDGMRTLLIDAGLQIDLVLMENLDTEDNAKIKEVDCIGIGTK